MRDQLSKYLPAEDHRAILSRRKLFELAGLAVASAAIPPGMAALATARPASSNSLRRERIDRKSTRLNSSHGYISYAVFCLKKKKNITSRRAPPSQPLPTPARCFPDLTLRGRVLRWRTGPADPNLPPSPSCRTLREHPVPPR